MYGNPERRPGAWPATLVWLAAALAATAALCAALFAGPREARFTAERPPPATGLHPVEQGDWGTFRWTRGAATLDLPNPGGPLLVRLRLAGGPRPVEARLSGPIEAALPLSPAPRRYALLAPPQPAERVALRIVAPPLASPGERRELGVQTSLVSLHGGGSPTAAALLAALLGAGALYATLRAAAGPAPAALGAVALVGALLGWQAAHRWTAGQLAPPVAAACVALAAALPARRLLQLAWRRWREAAPAWPGAPPALAAAAGLGLYLAVGLWNHHVVHPRLAFDLAIYRRAGRAILAGESPYAIFGLDVIGASFFYPPATLPLFAALAALDPGVVSSLWVAGNGLLFLLALLAIALALPGRGSRGAIAALAVLGLGFGPVLESLAIGQINGVMLLGLALFILGHGERRLAWLGDTALAIVILIKLTPAILLLWPLVRGDRARLLRVGAALAALCAPSLLLYGPAPWAEFAALVPDLLRGVPRNPYNQALVGALTALTPPGSPAEAAAAVAGRAASLTLLGTWALVCWRQRAGPSGPALAYGVAVLTVASSLIWYHHLSFLLIPLAWLGLAGPARGWGAAGALIALGLIHATRLAEESLGGPPWTAVAGYMLVAALLAAGLLARGRSAPAARARGPLAP